MEVSGARISLLSRGLCRVCRPSAVSSRRSFSTRTKLELGRPAAGFAQQSDNGLRSILRVSEEVADAVATNKPVVALESTIYTHGTLGNDLIWHLESVVRDNGGVPAVCGVLDGVPTVGLSSPEVERMVEEGAKKISRRDLAFITGRRLLGRKVHGGTTIAGTMVLAKLAGIRVFGTGGLGGVHRGGHDSLDISADLTELGRTRVAVISSGAKGFLDLPRTLEYLETQGVLAATFADGRVGDVDLPAFWARDSGVKSPFVVQDEREAAAIIYAQENLGIESGLLFANPIPEKDGIPREEMDAIIETAVREADEKGITGNANTPYILIRIKELTEGRALPANRALVDSNVRRATKVAVELSKLLADPPSPESPASTYIPPVFKSANDVKAKVQQSDPDASADILVAGSVALDLSCDFVGDWSSGSLKNATPSLHTSNPASISQSIGGVGHNVALAAHRISRQSGVQLCSLVGDDIAGSTILSAIASNGMDTSYIRKLGPEYSGARTAQYVAMNDSEKNLVMAMADMGIFTSHSFPVYWESIVESTKPKWMVVDANWSGQDIRKWARAGQRHGAKVAFEPVSNAKSARLFAPGKDGGQLGVYPAQSIDLATPNQYELAAMYDAARIHEHLSTEWFEVIDAFGMRGARDRFVKITSAELTDAGIPVQTVQLLPYIPTIVTKLGSQGALLTTILHKDDPRLRDPDSEPYILTRVPNDHPAVGGIYMRMFPVIEKVHDVVSVNGVGDTFLGTLVAGLARGGRVENLVDIAQKAAIMTLRSPQSVSDGLHVLERELAAAVKLGQGNEL